MKNHTKIFALLIVISSLNIEGSAGLSLPKPRIVKQTSTEQERTAFKACHDKIQDDLSFKDQNSVRTLNDEMVKFYYDTFPGDCNSFTNVRNAWAAVASTYGVNFYNRKALTDVAQTIEQKDKVDLKRTKLIDELRKVSASFAKGQEQEVQVIIGCWGLNPVIIARNEYIQKCEDEKNKRS